MAIEGVSKHFGTVKAVDGVTLSVRAGEFLSLVGPSGSGKTTLLMMIAGFDEPTGGRFVVGGRDITLVPPHKRDIGMVFQKYALFPHLTAAQNIAFPLRMRGVSRAERDRRARRALDMVKLPVHADRYPAQLSGGQQQRVALARALVFDPQVILMDEPLGALDKKLRQQMQLEIKELQQRLGATVIFVTHDQEEALTMSDRVAVMSDGRVEQVGSPRALYEGPASVFVADFLGNMNFFRGNLDQATGEGCRISVGGVAMGAQPTAGMAAQPGTPVRVAVRPERLIVCRRESGSTGIPGRIRQQVFNGASLTVVIDIADGTTVQAVADSRSAVAEFRPGDSVAVDWTAADAHVFAESLA